MIKSSVLTFLLGAILLLSCSEKKTQPLWKFSNEIPLGNISPIGIVKQNDFLWLSDVDNNRIVKINIEGKIIEEYDGFERPMHIAIQNDKIYIPEYISDKLSVLENGNVTTYSLNEQPDAMGGVAVEGDWLAVADFYNHRIILQKDNIATIIGKEGHNDGEFYYPTDVDIEKDLIYVADAYNNRIQVFDFEGNYVKMIGWNDNIKVATGVKVTDTQVVVADFEGNRVLIYDHNGKLTQTILDKLNKPTDIEVLNNNMYILNYSNNTISIYKLKY